MVHAQMTETERNEAIVSTYELNEQVCELGHTVADAEFRKRDQNEIAADLASVADSLAYELRESVMELVSKNLGPQQQANLMLVLSKAGEWLDEERKELEHPPHKFSGLRVTTREAARRLHDLNYFETFLRKFARDILRAMADFNFEQSRAR